MKTHSTIKTHHAWCRRQKGIPAINSHAWGYYASRAGERMLVMECSVGQRIRIDGTIEVVVLKIVDGEIQFGINDVADSTDAYADNYHS
jgi:hypothetical protein